MINKEEARITAWNAIADLVGIEYFRNHFAGSCESYPSEEDDPVDYEYFFSF